jgi:hypothetical protein
VRALGFVCHYHERLLYSIYDRIADGGYSSMSAIDWGQLLTDTRGFLATVGDLDEGDPVPVDELVEQAEANGYDSREVRDAIRDADALEPVGDLDDLRVRLADEAGDDTTGSYRPEDSERPLDQYDTRGYAIPVDDEDPDDTVRAHDAAGALTASSWGPPFATAAEDGGAWWEPAYETAARGVERAIVNALLASGEDPDGSGKNDEERGEEAGSPGDTPTPEAEETTTQTDEEAVEALRDVIRFYHNRVDDEIADHTDAGDHPDRPTTAREYFTQRRGWDSDTVDDLLLGWAPADHADRLVAWLHDRGHSREAILATGAVGESDSGGFYATLSARYVLPYYDADGEPAYAIARCTGGNGGGGRGYGGHPRDYKAGKYAKLRHTDERVPFDEPIYGLDTLEGADHVVVAEGIADAITAREAGYAVLSPVAKEFKEAHYDPLVDALEAQGVERVTIVADADPIYNEPGDVGPESIGEAVGVTLEEIPAGLDGALRTAAGIDSRTDLCVRVTVPPAPAGLENDLDDYVTGAWGGDLAALLRSARPPGSFDEYVEATATEQPAGAFDDFDAQDYEPSATSADETTTDIRDVYAAIDRLDARRVAEDTIVSEWLDDRGHKRTFAPVWAPAGYDGTANFVDRDKFVDTGGRGGRGGPAVMAAIDAGLVRDTECPRAVRGSTWFDAVDHLRELGYSIPKLEDDDSGEAFDDDPREVAATVDARRAWDAAGRVTPDDLDDTPLDTTDDGDGFACPACGDSVDVVRAVAIEEGIVDGCGNNLDNNYPKAYTKAREAYGAPLPEYYTTSDAIAEFDAVLDVIGEVTFWHLDTDALDTEITQREGEVDGEAVRALNPAWRESESETSVIVFDSGNIWDADTEKSLDALRFVALDSGLIDEPGDPLEGERFTKAYDRARRVYGAPLPRWEPAEDGAREVTPQLPPSDELVDGCEFDGVDTDALGDAREEVEALIENATADAEAPTVVTSLPATGKTTGTVKTAQDRPLAYLAPRKELQKQALTKAERWGVEAEVLPVFSDERVRDGVLNAAVSHVREAGKDRLRDRWGILAAAFDGLDEDDEEGDTPDLGDIFDEDGEEGDTPELQRPTCDTAEGDHGVAWALGVHVARRLGYTPREIHGQARGLFGAPLPCSCDEDGEKTDNATCEYSAGWDSVSDPDDPADLLVGSYIHAHVDSVRTEFTRGADGDVETSPRALVLDEYVGEAYVREFGEEAHDFATWLARCLRDDVEDRRDMFDAELWGDDWVRAWLDGSADEADAVRDAIAALARTGDLLDARESAVEILGEVDTSLLDTLGLADALERVADGDDAAAAFAELDDAIGSVDPEHPAAGISRWADDAVREPLDTATAGGSSNPSVGAADADALPIGADLRALVDDAVEAVEECRDGALPAIDAAVTALRGGREGCRRLAAWADDGYAHPDAHHLLTNIITPTGEESDDPDARRVRTSSWAFDPDATDGTVVDVVETGEKSRSVVDRNDHGALLQTPPSRVSAGGEDVPLVGLDATGRTALWANAVGEDVDTADIHTTPAERAEFLENALSLRVLQASDRPRSYEGDPATKDTDGDVALLESLAEEYAGVEAPRQRGDEAAPVGNPAAITTKGVREVLEADSRLDDVVAEWENYGNLTGANDLGDHRLAAILGSQHYGDHAIERFCALAGREVDTSRDGGRGGALGYDDDLAEAYLKHMSDDQTMQAILRFARGDSGATVVARTSALREDLPVVGRAQVVDTWSDTATTIAREYRRLGDEFTAADVADSVDVSRRQVRRVLAELVEAGYLRRVGGGDGVANVYEPSSEPGAGEVELPERRDAVANGVEGGHSATNQYYTWNVRVFAGEVGGDSPQSGGEERQRKAPPSPPAVDAVGPPG